MPGIEHRRHQKPFSFCHSIRYWENHIPIYQFVCIISINHVRWLVDAESLESRALHWQIAAVFSVGLN